MSDLIGETQHLTAHVVPFSAVHKIVGASGSGHFNLAEANGFRQLAAARAKVTIVSSTLQCQIICPASADKAATAHVAVIPCTTSSWPTSAEHVLTIGGSAFVQHSLYTGTQRVPLSFAPEVAHQIKPTPLVGTAPAVAYSFEITGGTKDTISHLVVSGTLNVDGVGFTTTW